MRNMPTFSWILGTTGSTTVKWYRFSRAEGAKITFELLDHLDLQRVSIFTGREDARVTAERAGVKSVRFVRL